MSKKIVRFTDITHCDKMRCFPDVDFGRHSIAYVVPNTWNEWQWRVIDYVCGPAVDNLIEHVGNWFLYNHEVEDVTEDEVDAAIAYCSLMGLYVGERVSC